MTTPAPLWRAMRHYRQQQGWVLLGFALACITLLAQIGLLALSGWFIAAMGVAGAVGASLNYFTPAAIIRALAMLRTAGRYGERLVTHDATLRMTASWRSWFYSELEQRAASGINWHSAEMFGRFRADIDRLERFFLQSLLPVGVSVATLTIVTVALLFFDGWLACGMLALLLFAGFGIPCWQAQCSRTAQSALTAAQSQLRQELAETLQGKSEVLIYGQTGARLQMIDRLSATIATQEKRLYGVESMAQGMLHCSIGLGVVLGISCGFLRVAEGLLPATYLAMLPLLCLGCFDTVAALPIALPGFAAARDAACRLYAMLDQPLPAAGTAELPASAEWQLHCDIPAVPGRLGHPIAFILEAGEVVACVGASGAGKSSLVQWMTGMLPLPAGAALLINQTSITRMDPANWRGQFTVAEQRPYLFMGTLRDNLRIADMNASDAAMHAACALAHFPLDTFAAGLDQLVDEQGNNLSGGQRRRLAVARALLRAAPCLILDEPTEGLDSIQAQSMMHAVLTHAKHKNQAVIIITHDPVLQHQANRAIFL